MLVSLFGHLLALVPGDMDLYLSHVLVRPIELGRAGTSSRACTAICSWREDVRKPSKSAAALAAGFGGLLALTSRHGRQSQVWRRWALPSHVASTTPPEGAFLPYGSEAGGCGRGFEENLEADGFCCPQRLRGVDAELVEEVNLWHYAMINDAARSEFFWNALKGCVQGRRVLDIGAGSGLLAMMAAKLGAASVVAIEASDALCEIAETNIERNALTDRVTVIHALSTAVECEDELRSDVVVSEIMGTLLNGESVIDYIADARERLAVPGARLLPAGGAQHCVLVASPMLRRFTSVDVAKTCHGLDLSAMDELRDTAQGVSPNSFGLNLGSLPDLVLMSKRTELFALDFATSCRDDIPQEAEYQLVASCDGVVDAVVATWEVWADDERKVRLSTHLGESDAFRDSHFSQVFQLVEDADNAQTSARPEPFEVTKGEQLLLRVRHTESRNELQFELRRAADAR